MTALLFDIGGTHTRLALYTEGVLGALHKEATADTPEGLLLQMRAFVGEHRLDLISGGVAGTVEEGVLLSAPNLPGWQGKNLERLIADTFRAHTLVANDADVEGLGEALEGAGRNHQIVGYLTLGTGVGGALIVDGALQPSVHGLEPGKQIITEEGRTLEDMVSGRSLARETGLSPKDIPAAFYHKRTTALAIGVYNLARLWSPEIIVLGGSMLLKEPGFSIDRLRIELTRVAGGAPMPELVPQELGDEAGLRGALALLC